MTRVLVVGAGIAGLSCAYELSRGGAQVTVLESRDRAGGVIVTERTGGYVIEGGPDSILSIKPAGLELVKELGLGDRIVPALSRRVYVQHADELHPLPEGVFLTVPTKLGPMLKSRLFTLGGKLRMGMDLVLPRGSEVEDESLGSFVRRRLGRQALERLAEPLMAGIYLADAEELSLRATFPRFLDMEREHRSLIRALRRAPPGGSVSPFVSLRGGLGELVEKLVAALPTGSIRTGCTVRAIFPGWTVRLDGESLSADRVVLAVPPPAAATLLNPHDPELAAALESIRAASSATVSLGWPASAVARPLDGTGFVIPRAERGTILACTWTSSKFEGRAPEGKVLVRAFIGETGLGAGDAELIASVRWELERRIGAKGEPEIARVFRWPAANPIYRVGHDRRVREIEERSTAKLPGLSIIGSGLRGIGIPDNVKEGRATARRILGV